ncbi:hypothetical protein ACJMK2_033744 [Sinanodonta woodiana]|uniref:Uncharacterized protein n=1 Tax=Sinanodonta woodiana TaxID=1069815 RepID=A0ABD3WT34_SINWO
MKKVLDDDLKVENTNQCEDEGENEVVNNSTEMPDTDKYKDIEVDKRSAVMDVLSKLQIADMAMQNIKMTSFAISEEAKEEPMPFFWEKDILRRNRQSGDGSCGGKPIAVPGGL